MLNITTITRQSTGSVARYYADAADDYYAKEGEQMRWDGAGAAALGLEGNVDAARFKELMAGRIDPQTKMRRVKIGDYDKERLGYDLTFSAPKGVTLQGLVHGDARIISAHDRAVSAAIKEAESMSMARSTVGGTTRRENTNNLVVASFRHETSRELDPQLHTHAFVMNMTQRSDGKWRALTNDGIVNSLSHIGNVYKASLAKELQEQGFELRFQKGGTFDLAHISDEQIAAFSARSAQIESALSSKGLDRATATAAEKDQIALATRRAKSGRIDPLALRRTWQDRSLEVGVDFTRTHWAGIGHTEHAIPDRTHSHESDSKGITDPVGSRADECVKFAVARLTERQAVVSGPALNSAALEHAYGVANNNDIKKAIERQVRSGELIRESPRYQSMKPAEGEAKGKPVGPSRTRSEWVSALVESGRSPADAVSLVKQGIAEGRLVEGHTRYTTPLAQSRERHILNMERQGRGRMEPVMSPEIAQARLQAAGLIDGPSRLQPGQLEAVKQAATTSNQFTAVQGYAGTGKSYMTAAAKGVLEAEGFTVKGLAMYGNQVTTLKNEGIDSRTVASFLRGKNKGIDEKTVVVLDEAAVVNARQMRDVMQTVSEHGARMVMLGDVNQTKAIEAGKPMEQLIAGGMSTAYMTEIQRQKNPELREAVELAAQGDAAKALKKIPTLSEVQDPNARYAKIAQDFMAQPEHERSQSIVLSGTNDSRRQINSQIRGLMGLAGKGLNYDLIHREDLTQVERSHSRYYEKGQIIVPERDYENGLKRGEQYRVLDTGPGNRLTVAADGESETIRFNPSRSSSLSVYRVNNDEIAAGDHVKIQRNIADLDLRSGEQFRVRSVSSNALLLEGTGGRLVSMPATGALPLAHAYASTVHSAQGMTENRIFANLDSKSRTTTKEVFYVAVSRARYQASLYTDSEKNLPASVQSATYKPAALDLRTRSAVEHRQYERTKGYAERGKNPREVAAESRQNSKRSEPVKKRSGRSLER